jgi:opacity protein-like surface antigen
MKTAQKAGLALVLATASASVFADTTNFEGLSAFIGASTVTSSMKMEFDGAIANGLGKSSFATSVGSDYGLKLSDTAVVLLGGTYNLGSVGVFEVSDGLDLEGEGKLKSMWSLYAAPGVTFGKDVLLYGKLAYVSAKPDSEGAKTHTGMGYGVGARFALANQMFLNIEFMQNSIGKKTYVDGNDSVDISGSSTAGTVALGYRF